MNCKDCGAEMIKQVRCCDGRYCSCYGGVIDVEVDECPNPNCFVDGMLGDGGADTDTNTDFGGNDVTE